MRRSNARPPPSDPQPPMDTTISRLHFRSSTSRHPRHPWIFVSVLAAVLSVLFLLLAFRSGSPKCFSIVIDGGSTGTRIHVYAYSRGRGSVPVKVDLRASGTMKASPGLSAFADQPEKAGQSLGELVEFGRRMIPRDLWGETDVRLMATAGMRLLHSDVQERILESCRRVLRKSGFQFERDWATVISGSSEGIYAWVTANYALGTLGSNPAQTTGIIELGGASAQITFVSSEPFHPKFSHFLKFGEITYNLYSHSFLHLGQNVAYESHLESMVPGLKSTDPRMFHEEIVKDPCTPKGYVHGQDLKSAGNFSECRSAALMLLQKGKDKCVYRSCNMGQAFVPKLRGRFLATENFFYTSQFFKLRANSFLSNMVMAGERFCSQDWSSLKKEHHALSEEDLSRYCFSSAYIVAMLHDSLGIALDDNRIMFVNEVGGIPLDWSLGAFIVDSISHLDTEQPHSFSNFVHSNFSALLLVLFVFALIFTVWSISRWKKPQLKTIYDLEKGRYIVSRISP